MRDVLVCGAGAVGSSYLERLHDLDPARVAAIASGERRARLDRDGLTVNGRHLQVRTAGPEDGGPAADLRMTRQQRVILHPSDVPLTWEP